MSDGIAYYGHFELEGSRREGYPLADWLFGHRLHEGQHWIEYLLEFLNVLAGFEYELGQGIDSLEGRRGYFRFPRLGLRRFVFYDDRERTRDPRDNLARDKLWQALQERVADGARNNEPSPIEIARQLLRSYSAVEEERSWFAKSLFPAHHNLLFWEALRKGATRWQQSGVPPDTPIEELDRGIELTARNFYARGGEVYYLVLSAGTEDDQQTRAFIVNRLRLLLNNYNVAVGRLAAVIDETWSTLRRNASGFSPEHEGPYELGWLPNSSCELYRLIAQDIATFLRSELDPLESLDLLAHLICFHLLQHIYHRSHPACSTVNCTSGNCVETCRPLLPVDCLEGRSSVIRQLSASLYKEREHRQVEKAHSYVRILMDTWMDELASDPNFAENLQGKAEHHFNVRSLRSDTRAPYEGAVRRLQEQCGGGALSRAAYTKAYAQELTGLLLIGYRRHFLPVHRKLAQRIGFVTPRTGQSQRYVLGDTLLKALVLANVPPSDRLSYDSFLGRLYERYGVAIGQREARQSGLYDRQPINVSYYDDNRAALHEKLKNAGLLEEYSDATALVVNRFREAT